jgi:hypothetical protein
MYTCMATSHSTLINWIGLYHCWCRWRSCIFIIIKILMSCGEADFGCWCSWTRISQEIKFWWPSFFRHLCWRRCVRDGTMLNLWKTDDWHHILHWATCKTFMRVSSDNVWCGTLACISLKSLYPTWALRVATRGKVFFFLFNHLFKSKRKGYLLHFPYNTLVAGWQHLEQGCHLDHVGHQGRCTSRQK